MKKVSVAILMGITLIVASCAKSSEVDNLQDNAKIIEKLGDGQKEVTQTDVKRIIEQSSLASQKIVSYSSVQTGKSLYYSKRRIDERFDKNTIEYNKSIGFHINSEFSSGEKNEFYVFHDKDFVYSKVTREPAETPAWKKNDESYKYLIGQRIVDWDVSELLDISDISWNYLGKESPVHRFEYKGKVGRLNEGAAAEALLGTGILVDPFLGFGQLQIWGLVEIDEKTFHQVSNHIIVIFNREHESPIEYNYAQMEVQWNRQQINQINRIELPEEARSAP
ncbi:hypothetical protein J31TS4_18010 [Paenibacillus sp. J31TS4]|uniref:hypothetical protein n=1 Tax=Paenibacillus sp. J31TS4 TaxID=2807195 RepID=UPI001B14AF86|nr:hypothetical protein [Paenibacillus sp. J31TS4]GIP38521.1 hypothetical protein J31TS4_18010 [Paenibacillus sp. J31TS4]